MRPRSATKANTSGTPAKFAPTPEKDKTALRIHPGSPPRVIAQASSPPKTDPLTAVIRLTSSEFCNQADEQRILIGQGDDWIGQAGDIRQSQITGAIGQRPNDNRECRENQKDGDKSKEWN